jgi:putative secretion ATPase (PEP-CTERM system associated)
MMYLEHFGLSQPPFRLSPDPEFLYLSKQHAKAKAYMESTIWLADGFVVITGEIGSGKTTLIHSFLDELDDDVVFAHVTQTQLSPVQFLQTVLADFGFEPFKKRKAELLDMLNMFLIEQFSKGRKVVLIVDEAQNLSEKVLEEVRMLSGVETHKEKVLRIILAGQPELKDKVNSPELKQLAQRVRLRFHLSPLKQEETEEYIRHRIAVAGNESADLFDDDTFDPIFKYTGGVPRLINTLCDTALLCAYAEERDHVSLDDLSVAVDELDWEEYASITSAISTEGMDFGATNNLVMAKLMIGSDGEITDELPLTCGRVIIGRTPDNDLRLNSKYVSRHHAQLITDLQQTVLEDLNSTNGLYVDAKRTKKRRLKNGDMIQIGRHELTYNDQRDTEGE